MTSLGTGEVTTRRKGLTALRSRTPETLVLLCIVGAGALLRIWRAATRTTLSLDEFQIAGSLRDYSFLDLLTRRLMYDQSAPPGFLLTVRGAFVALGSDERALRLLPLAGGLAVLVVALRLAQQQLHTAAARVALVALLSLSPLLIDYSSIVKQYSTDALASVALLAAWAARDRPHGRSRLAAIGVVCALTSLPSIFTLAAIGSVLVVSGAGSPLEGSARPFRRMLASVRTHAVLAVAWGTALLIHAAHGSLATDRQDMVDYWTRHGGLPPENGTIGDRVDFVTAAISELTWLGLASGREWVTIATARDAVTPIALALILAVTVIGLRHRSADVAVPLVSLALGLLAGALGLYPATGRLLTWSIPLTAYLIATTIDHHKSRAPVSRLLAIVVALIVSLSLISSALSVMSAATNWRAPFTTSREAFTIVASQAEPGDILVIDRWTRFAYFWHGPDTLPAQLPVEILRLVDVRPGEVERLVELTRQHRVWIVSSHRSREAAENLAPFLLIWEEGFRLEELDLLVLRIDS